MSINFLSHIGGHELTMFVSNLVSLVDRSCLFRAADGLKRNMPYPFLGKNRPRRDVSIPDAEGKE